MKILKYKRLFIQVAVQFMEIIFYVMKMMN